MKWRYVSSHEQPKLCPGCNLSIERKLIAGSAKCDVVSCTECGYILHVVDYHIFSLGEDCLRLEHFQIQQSAVAK